MITEIKEEEFLIKKKKFDHKWRYSVQTSVNMFQGLIKALGSLARCTVLFKNQKIVIIFPFWPHLGSPGS